MSRPDCYQPQLPRETIHRLWMLAQSSGRPMTALLREALETYLAIRAQEPAQR